MGLVLGDSQGKQFSKGMSLFHTWGSHTPNIWLKHEPDEGSATVSQGSMKKFKQ